MQVSVHALKARLYRWISSKYMDGCSNYNSLAVRRSCRSKAQARAVFSKHEVPHAQGRIFLSPMTAIAFAREHGFPLVVKPNVSGFSRGSHFPINNYRELWKAILMVKVWWPTSVIEQYLLGKNYRVLATPDSLASVIQRYPPFIDGDGHSTIGELIDEENRVRESMGLYPVIHPIEKNRQTLQYLKRQGYSLDSIPAKAVRVSTFNRVALAPGGVVETIDQQSITPKNAALFKNVVEMFDANLLGIDVIFEKGIDVDYDQQKCIFLEVNSRPYIKMHHVPRYGEPDDLSGFFERMDDLVIADTDIF